mmetsp:Transcript_70342/g.197266  ORF Transcript_70342/g.197266 Transcript_70342/m.197266 type:complete len:257 (-) Transcript_70342:102-872(-)
MQWVSRKSGSISMRPHATCAVQYLVASVRGAFFTMLHRSGICKLAHMPAMRSEHTRSFDSSVMSRDSKRAVSQPSEMPQKVSEICWMRPAWPSSQCVRTASPRHSSLARRRPKSLTFSATPARRRKASPVEPQSTHFCCSDAARARTVRKSHLSSIKSMLTCCSKPNSEESLPKCSRNASALASAIGAQTCLGRTRKASSSRPWERRRPGSMTMRPHANSAAQYFLTTVHLVLSTVSHRSWAWRPPHAPARRSVQE